MKRKSGVLLPLFSLPGPFGCGTFSREAYDFVSRIRKAGFTLWQVLPFGVPDAFHSPYMSLSSFGGNPFFIDPEELLRQGLVTKEEVSLQMVESPWKCDYAFLSERRMAFLKKAAARVRDRGPVLAFLEKEPLVAQTCFFLALREENGQKPFSLWKKEKPGEDVLFAHQFIQYEFHRQWDALHRFALSLGVEVIGDLPFYVSEESFDRWCAPASFQLDETGRPTKVAGVPPDYFSPDGQKWGNPLYDWDQMEKDGFSYWKGRLSYQLRLFDYVRMDHFRAASGYFAIPAEAESAKEGIWMQGPGKKLIDAFSQITSKERILAEDLGTIDQDTRDLLSYADYAGMAVFQFGFDGNPLSPHLPHNFKENLVAYSGTHDNNTLLGFYFESGEEIRRQILSYLGDPRDAVEGILRSLMRSRACKVIFPLQDLLGYGADTRINTPGTACGNWTHRFTWEQINALDTEKYKEMNRIYARG